MKTVIYIEENGIYHMINYISMAPESTITVIYASLRAMDKLCIDIINDAIVYPLSLIMFHRNCVRIIYALLTDSQ